MAEARLAEAIEALVKRQGWKPVSAMPVFKAPQFDGEGDYIQQFGCSDSQSVGRAGPATIPQRVAERRVQGLSEGNQHGWCFQQPAGSVWFDPPCRTKERKQDHPIGTLHEGRAPGGSSFPWDGC